MRRLILSIDGQGKIEVLHDNLSAAELATCHLIVGELALETLKNGPTGNTTGGGGDGGDGSG